MPTWADTNGIIFPADLALQQCSSETTARYKAGLVRGDSLIDLTGGLGVDFSFMAAALKRATYVERQEALCQIAKQNFDRLGLTNAHVVCDNAEHFSQLISEPESTIFLDPARRDTHGNRTYAIADCSPNVAYLAPMLLKKALRLIVKLSPMLDISQGIREMPDVRQVHVVSTDGECKELLFVMENTSTSDKIEIICVDDKGTFVTHFGADYPAAQLWNSEATTPKFLYEPNPSVMKAGCFNHLAKHFTLQAVGRNCHLFVSNDFLDSFPGRAFVIDAVSSMNKKELRQHLSGITSANVSTRNFPVAAPQLAKRLRLADGGDTYIFATTTDSGEHRLFITHKP